MLRRDGVESDDSQLLSSFIERHDENALAALVHRHGPMVWGVCRRLLSHHDAEDAFQATFVVLVRNAASIVPRAMVGNWLYGVAHKTALQARRSAARRLAKEIQVTQMPDTEAVAPDPAADIRPLLDEGLSRLPHIYRTVVVLCDLEGRTRKEVARHLGLPEGTVAARVARGRALLAKRLKQRGVTLSGGALAAALAGQAASAAMPKSVVAATIKTASLSAAGQAAAKGVVSVKVAALTDGVMKMMLLRKLKSATAVVLILGFIATGATLLTYRSAAGQDDKKPGGEKPVKQETKQRSDKQPVVGAKQATQKEIAEQAAAVRFGKLRWNHGEDVRSAAFSPDGKLLATGGASLLRIFNAATGEIVHTLRGHAKAVAWLTFAPDGGTLLSSSNDGTLREWNVATGELTRVLLHDARYINQASFSPDGKTIAVGVDVDKGQALQYLALLDAKSGKETARLKIDAYQVVFSPDGKYLATTGAFDRRAFLIDAGSRRTVCELTAQVLMVNHVAFTPDSRTLISDPGYIESVKDRKLNFWDVRTGRLTRSLTIPNSGRTTSTYTFASDSKTLFSGGSLIDLDEGEPINEKITVGEILAVTPDGRRLAGKRGSSGRIVVYDRTNGTEVAPAANHDSPVAIIVPASDGKTITTFAGDGQRIEWNSASGAASATTALRAPAFSTFTVASDAGVVAISWRSEIELYDAAGVAKRLKSARLAHGGAMAFSSDGALLATTLFERSQDLEESQWRVELIDVSKDEVGSTVVFDFMDGDARPRAIALAASGKALALAIDGKVLLVDLASQARNEQVAAGEVTELQFSPDGKTLAIVDKAGNVILADVATGKERLRLTKRFGPILFTPDSKQLATIDEQNVIHVCDAASGVERARYAGHKATVRSLAFSRDSTWLYAGSEDTTALGWQRWQR
jgi:RNA polymerase sigma factor (sigma-70 family)